MQTDPNYDYHAELALRAHQEAREDARDLAEQRRHEDYLERAFAPAVAGTGPGPRPSEVQAAQTYDAVVQGNTTLLLHSWAGLALIGLMVAMQAATLCAMFLMILKYRRAR